MLCKIWGYHGSDYEECSLLGCYAVWLYILVFLRSVRRLLVTASVVPISPIRVTLMMEALRSSETPVLTRATQRDVPEDGIILLTCPRCCLIPCPRLMEERKTKSIDLESNACI
jgi:hypothetical protein